VGHPGIMPKIQPSARNQYVLDPDLKIEAPAPSEVAPDKKKMDPRDQRKYAASKPRHSFKNLPEGWTREKVARAYETAPLRGIPKSTWLEKWAEKYLSVAAQVGKDSVTSPQTATPMMMSPMAMGGMPQMAMGGINPIQFLAMNGMNQMALMGMMGMMGMMNPMMCMGGMMQPMMMQPGMQPGMQPMMQPGMQPMMQPGM